LKKLSSAVTAIDDLLESLDALLDIAPPAPFKKRGHRHSIRHHRHLMNRRDSSRVFKISYYYAPNFINQKFFKPTKYVCTNKTQNRALVYNTFKEFSHHTKHSFCLVSVPSKQQGSSLNKVESVHSSFLSLRSNCYKACLKHQVGVTKYKFLYCRAFFLQHKFGKNIRLTSLTYNMMNFLFQRIQPPDKNVLYA